LGFPTLHRNARLVLLAVVVSTIGCDQASKHAASVYLVDGARRSYLGDSIRLEYSENAGAFLSLGANLPEWARTALFSVGTALLLAGCVVAAASGALTPIALLGLWLLFAGGLSNLFDRVMHGRVVDFLNVGIGPVRTGIFNVADMAILLGVALLIVCGSRRTVP
jgi:signal peptidase II